MKISELEPNSKVINLVAVIASLDETTKTPTGVSVQEGILTDSSGQIKLSLWGDQTDVFKVGDKVIISTGWCKEFLGDMQVTTGKFGKINLVPKEIPEE